MNLELFVFNANISACKIEIENIEIRISKLPNLESWNKIQANYYNEQINDLKSIILNNQSRILNILNS